MTNPYKKYQRTQVTTASREKVLLMLYEGAIRFIKQASVAMKAGKTADKGKYISKATAILSELMATLDFKTGGQLAADLENLYVFMIDKLIEGNINNDEECLVQVETLLMTLYQAWKDVIDNPRPDGVPSASLQPDEYKKYVSENGEPKQFETANEAAKDAQANIARADSDKSNLKVVA